MTISSFDLRLLGQSLGMLRLGIMSTIFHISLSRYRDWSRNERESEHGPSTSGYRASKRESMKNRCGVAPFASIECSRPLDESGHSFT